MMLNDSELNIVIAALRHCATTYEQQTRATLNRLEAVKLMEFSKACAYLSNRLDNERPKASRLILPDGSRRGH